MHDHCATTEEVNLQVKLGEERMAHKVETSHQATAKVLSNFIGEMTEKLDKLDEKADQSILDRNSIHSMLGESLRVQAQILEQTQKTNGRVSRLENWRSYILGALAALATLILPIAFMIISEIISHVKLGV
jgi:anti-sigma-K factor RskA